MKPDNIDTIVIEHKAFGHGKSFDEWWEVTVEYYNGSERFILHSIDEILSFMQKNRQEFMKGVLK